MANTKKTQKSVPSSKSKTTNGKSQTPTKEKKRVKETNSKVAKVDSANNPIVAAISPIQPGLIKVCIRESSQAAHVRNAIEYLAAAGSKKLGTPMPEVNSVLSLYSGNVRQLEQAEALSNANMPIPSEVQHNYKVCGSRDGFDWSSDEGLCVLLPIIEEAEGWVTLEQKVDTPIKATFVDGLSRIRNAAKQSGVWVMLFLVCKDGHEQTRLHELCDEYFDVAPCEPDIGFDIAFSIDCVGLHNLNTLGIGKTMCNVKLHEGKFHRKYTPYISSDLETRVMWYLRGQKKSLDEIGKILKKDKSTVLRRLQGLPAPKPLKVKDEWLERNLEVLGLSNQAAGSKSGEKADNDGGADARD